MPRPVTPLLAADVIIELVDRPGRPIVLIERRHPPPGWAIAGGFVDVGETVEAAKRLAERRMTLELSDAARDLLARKGYDRVYGARPLKRAIQQYIENPLAMEILKGRFDDGAKICADLEGDKIVFAAA